MTSDKGTSPLGNEMITMKILYGIFILFGFLSVIYSNSLQVNYQDSWLLENIWLFIVILNFLYLVILIREKQLSRVALLSSYFVFLLYFLPAIKYEFLYGTSIDVVYHERLAKEISYGHFNFSEIYSPSPGFHSIAAVLSQISSLSVDTCLKFLSPYLSFMIPLAVYSLSQAGKMPTIYTKILLAFSILITPNLYRLNGTIFATFFVVTIVALYSLRELNKHDKFVYSVSIIFCLLALIFWHPPSSLVLPAILLFLGIVSSAIKSMPFKLQGTRAFLILGLLGIVLTFTYWMYNANIVWAVFVSNFKQLLLADSTPSLIPAKVFELSLGQQIIVVLLNHARDFLFIGLAIFGSGGYLYKKYKKQANNLLLEIYSLLFISFLALIVLIFLVQFGTQGYKRFLFYIVAFSVLPAGYGFHNLIDLMKRKFHLGSGNRVLFFSLVTVFMISFCEIYPYQPIVPESTRTDNSASPVVWMHEVNTVSQYYVTKYVGDNLLFENHPQILIDYVGDEQSILFWGFKRSTVFRLARYPKNSSGYLVLHTPGRGGPYTEQSEYRGSLVIEMLKNYPEMSIIYNNGESFILYYPEDLASLGVLKK